MFGQNRSFIFDYHKEDWSILLSGNKKPGTTIDLRLLVVVTKNIRKPPAGLNGT
ncbi:hypothetical protein B4100_2784 [Heyndrickxia coagulans]|nr:hypothetical protein B4100_2784 [Heyndrickxia coagulans]